MKFFKKIKLILILLIILIIGISIYSYYLDSKTTITNSTNLDSNLILDNNSLYEVYFCPENDCNTILYNKFNKAKTIDCAIYDITLNWVYNTLKDKNARVITDNDQLTDYGKQFNFVKTDSSSNYMHNKFCIIDSNLLLIGSLNFTQDAMKKQNNNFIITNNQIFIAESQKYFDILWNNNFTKGFNENNFCNSPSNCMLQYIKETNNAKKSIKCMFFSFTYDDFEKALIEKQKLGVDIELILEKSQNSQYSEYNKLKDAGIKVIWDQNPSYMHNKFCVFDNSIIITGSMNPSNNGNFNNNESIIIMNNSEIAKQYESYFNKYFSMWS